MIYFNSSETNGHQHNQPEAQLQQTEQPVSMKTTTINTTSIKHSLITAYQTIEKLEKQMKKLMREAKENAKRNTEPSENITSIVSRLSHATMNDTLGYWVKYRSFGEERKIVLWQNGAVTSFNETNTKNPMAMFRTRQKAIAVLRKAGWNVPYSLTENGSPICRKFIIATI